MSTRTFLAGRPLLAVLMALLLVAPAFVRTPDARAYPRGGAADSIARIIPTKPVVVEILSPKLSREVEDIAVKLEAAARHNPAWFQAYTQRHTRPLPWHPNLGVTKPEYQRYLDESANVPLAVTQRATLTFKRDGTANRWTLEGWGKLTPINGTVIDLDRAIATNRRGRLDLIGTARPDKEQQAARLDWRWFGTFRSQHGLVKGGASGQALVASLHIGPLGDGSTTGIYWSYRRFNDGRKMDDEFLLLRFANEPR